MAKKRYTPETIIRKLREAKVLQRQGQTIAQVVKQLGSTEQIFYRWRREYGGMRGDQARHLKELEAENARLKRAVAEPLQHQAPTNCAGLPTICIRGGVTDWNEESNGYRPNGRLD